MRRTRVIRRFNYAKAAFYVWALACIAFVATNAVVKVMAVKALGVQ